MRVLLLHDTQHDLHAVESVLVANGHEVRSMAVNAITLQDEAERWNPALILITADDAARDVMEQIVFPLSFANARLRCLPRIMTRWPCARP